MNPAVVRRFPSRLRGASLGVKLIVFSALLSSAIVAVILLAMSFAVRSQTRDLLAQTLARHQRMLADIQARSFRDIVRASTLMSENPTLLAAMETYRMESVPGAEVRHDLLATIQIEAEKIAGGLDPDLLIVTGPGGHVLARSGDGDRLPAVGDDLSDHHVIRHALSQESPVGEANFSMMSLRGAEFQVGSVPIVLQGFIIGTLTLGNRIDQAFVDDLRASLDSHIVVFAGTQVLGATVHPSDLEPSSLLDADRHDAASIRIDDDEWVTARVKLGRDGDGRPVTLYLLRSLTGALAGSEWAFLWTLAGYGLIMVMMTGLSVWLVSRSVLRPLESLVTFMRTAARSGDRTGRFETPRASAEVKVLAETFNQLMSSLQENERRLLEKAREDLERLERLKESEKLAALGRMLSGAAHEINNPMTGVIGHIELLLHRDDLDDGVRQRLEEVRKQGHRIVALTRNLLKVARRDGGQRAPVDLHQVLLDTVALRRRDYERAGIGLELELPPERIRIMGSELELSQVFLNIINNAFDALKEAGGGRKLAIHATDRAEEATIVFSDDGPGMKDPSQVFEHFYTTKLPGQGTGLGLGISQAIVESHGGRITAANNPGGGARFTIDLPHGEWTEAVQRPSTASSQIPATRRSLPASVLVVDDEPVVRELQMAILDSLGAKAVAAASGSEAIEQLRRHDFDLVVTDLMVDADVTGRALYEWAADHRREGARGMVFVTAEAGDGSTFPGGEEIISLRKPFEMDEYIAVLREAWNESR